MTINRTELLRAVGQPILYVDSEERIQTRKWATGVIGSADKYLPSIPVTYASVVTAHLLDIRSQPPCSTNLVLTCEHAQQWNRTASSVTPTMQIRLPNSESLQVFPSAIGDGLLLWNGAYPTTLSSADTEDDKYLHRGGSKTILGIAIGETEIGHIVGMLPLYCSEGEEQESRSSLDRLHLIHSDIRSRTDFATAITRTLFSPSFLSNFGIVEPRRFSSGMYKIVPL